jgi:DHA3 family macrolide efflux protein-like MFS transporter
LAQKEFIWISIQDVGAGFKYMASWPGLLMLGMMATLLNFLLAPTSALTPLLVTKYFGKGALELGSLDSFFGVGMIAGGITLSVWGGFKKKIITSLTGIISFSFAVLAIAAAPSNSFWIMVVSMFVIGFMMPMANGPIQALFQSLVEPNMQGRVLSLISSVAQAMMPISLLVAGPVTDATSYETWFWVAGIFGVGSFFIPVIINIEDNHKFTYHLNKPGKRPEGLNYDPIFRGNLRDDMHHPQNIEKIQIYQAKSSDKHNGCRKLAHDNSKTG